MADKTRWESVKAEGDQLIDRLKKMVHEGNVRRVVVQHAGKTVAEFPLTAGLVGVVLAPVLAAVGVLVVMIEDCTIQVEHAEATPGRSKKDTRVA